MGGFRVQQKLTIGSVQLTVFRGFSALIECHEGLVTVFALCVQLNCVLVNLGAGLISGEQIQQAVERLVVAANPTKIILFGSYARGDATEASDFDLMVIEPEVANKSDEMVRLHRAVGDVGIGVDVLVYSDHEAFRRN